MIDLEGLRVPDGAPEAGACIRVERPEPTVARIVLDPPHRPKIAVLDVPLLLDLDRAVDEVERDRDLQGVVITGRGPLSFAAGADVDTIAEIEDPELAAKLVRNVQELFARIERLGREGGGRLRTVAAVGGPVPGGACELSLACDRIVLVEHPKTRIGLPEVLLGIFPSWGGATRLPRRIGVPAALPAILGGKLYPAKKAYKPGLVDRLTKPEYLLDVADDIAAGRKPCGRRRRSGLKYWLVDRNPLAGAIIASQARKGVLKQTRGHYPAPLAVLPIVVRSPRVSLAESLRSEVDAVRPLATSPVTKNLVRLFLQSEEAKKLAQGPEGTSVEPFTRAAVIGGGVMGAGIASILAEKGIAARLRDIDRAPLDAAQVAHRREIEKKRKRRRLEKHAANGAIDRLEVTTDATGFKRCDIVIEAVAERLDVKQAVFGEMAALVADDAILATNTSSLSVDAIAEGLPHPERVVGLHFFNPVRRMPLVEIVRGTRTSEETLARVAKLAIDLGKTPVVTRDVAGFLVNRLLGPYLDEAVRLVAAGAEPDAIDTALVAFGMPMGPIELIDEVGLDIAAHAAKSLFEAYGERMQPSTHLQPLVAAGQLGKKTGAGLYVWEPGKGSRLKKAGRNPKAASTPSGVSFSREELVDRLVGAMINEAARCIEEEVVDGPGSLDLATVFGTGFAPFRGGVLRHADERGLDALVGVLRGIEMRLKPENERPGRFEPAPELARLAESGSTFHG